MRIINRTDFPTPALRPLLDFGARGTRDSGVRVELIDDGTYHGVCCQGTAVPREHRKTYRCLVQLWLPFSNCLKFPKGFYNGYDLKHIHRRWPHGFPFDDFRDAVVYLAAHEFRHVWQYDRLVRARRQRRKVSSKCEHDAELFALRRLNQYRLETGRDIVTEEKQEVPEALQRAAACRRPKS